MKTACCWTGIFLFSFAERLVHVMNMATAVILGLDAANFMLALLLVTLGLVIIFGLMNVINMAHGEMFLLGAYTVFAVEQAGGPFWLGLLLAPIVLALFGLAVEELVIRHVYHRFIDTILATWGLSIAIKQAVIVAFGPTAQQVFNPLPRHGDRAGRRLSGLSPVHHGGGDRGRRRNLPAFLPHPARPGGARRHRQPHDGGEPRHQYTSHGPGDLRVRRRRWPASPAQSWRR